MLYYAVARDGHDGGAQITASHNPKQYNGIKMVRREAFPLSGDAGICDIRDMIAAGQLPRGSRDAGLAVGDAHRRRLRREGAVVHRPVDHQAVQRGARCRQRHRRHGRPAALREAALPHDRPVHGGRRHVPQPRSQPAHRGEPPRHRRARQSGKGGHRHRLGRRRRPRLLHRRHRRVRRRRLRDGAARRSVPDQASRREGRLRRPRQLRGQGHRRQVRRHGADEPRRPRVLQAAHARGERDLRRRSHRATTTSAISTTPTTASSRRC